MDYDNVSEWIMLVSEDPGMEWIRDLPEYQIRTIFHAGVQVGRNDERPYNKGENNWNLKDVENGSN